MAILLEDDPAKLASEIRRYRSRIGSAALTEKLDNFVEMEREKKDVIRRYAREHSAELVVCIVRDSTEPKLPRPVLERVLRAAGSYSRLMKTRPSAAQLAQTKDDDVRLIVDMQLYLRLISKERDAGIIREMLSDDEVGPALETLAEPFV